MLPRAAQAQVGHTMEDVAFALSPFPEGHPVIIEAGEGSGTWGQVLIQGTT
jgi:hypothetical protein